MEAATIAAIATPVGSGGGIGIIRISGTEAFRIGDAIFRGRAASSGEDGRTGSGDGNVRDSHHLYYGHIVDPETRQVVDEVLVSMMAASHSYTREDIVEINAHGGRVVMREIVDLVVKQGARPAEPGEFTRRAYLNGRIDLTQAEAVADVINAKSRTALKLAALQIKGELKRRIEQIREKLIRSLVLIEAAIDFPEEGEQLLDEEGTAQHLDTLVLMELDALIQQHDGGHVYRDGLRIVVVGKPNVGKSSLVNRLLKEDRIIVTDVPGTTRDVIEESININGIAAILTDTAGLHAAEEPVEILGIQKTKEYIEKADLVFFLVDAGSPVSEQDLEIFGQIEDARCVLIWNKIDLVKDNDSIHVPGVWENLRTVRISALYNRGIERLKEMVVRVCEEAYTVDEGLGIVPNVRQCVALKKSRASVEAAIQGIEQAAPSELISLDLQAALDALGEIIGLTPREEILSEIFDKFCIGK